MFSFFKKKPAAPDAEAPTDSVPAATPAVTPEPEPAAEPVAEAPKGWLNRLRRSFGSDEEQSPAAAEPEAAGLTPEPPDAADSTVLPPISEEDLERAAMEAATEHELPPEIIEPAPAVAAPPAAFARVKAAPAPRPALKAAAPRAVGTKTAPQPPAAARLSSSPKPPRPNPPLHRRPPLRHPVRRPRAVMMIGKVSEGIAT